MVFGESAKTLANVDWIGIGSFASAFFVLRKLKWNPIPVSYTHLRLIDAGHSHIAGIFVYDNYQSVEKFQGMAEAMRNRGLELNEDVYKRQFMCRQHRCWMNVPLRFSR